MRTRIILLSAAAITFVSSFRALAVSPLIPGDASRDLTKGEIILSVAVLAFVLLVICAVLLIRTKQVISGDATFKIVGLFFVIGAALFLVTAGYSLEQVTPVMGLLGTALGFVFGKVLDGGTPSGGSPTGGSPTP